MWPKVFAQLVELLPHISRLIPMADMFFTTKSASEKANEAALSALAQDVRTDLSRVTSAHDSLYRQLQEQSGQIATVAADFSRVHAETKASLESTAARFTALEGQLKALRGWLIAIATLLALIFGGIVALLVRGR